MSMKNCSTRTACQRARIFWPEFLCLILKFVAYTPDAFDLDGMISLEMVAQAGDIDIETAEIEVVVVAPEFLQEG